MLFSKGALLFSRGHSAEILASAHGLLTPIIGSSIPLTKLRLIAAKGALLLLAVPRKEAALLTEAERHLLLIAGIQLPVPLLSGGRHLLVFHGALSLLIHSHAAVLFCALGGLGVQVGFRGLLTVGLILLLLGPVRKRHLLSGRIVLSVLIAKAFLPHLPVHLPVLPSLSELSAHLSPHAAHLIRSGNAEAIVH